MQIKDGKLSNKDSSDKRQRLDVDEVRIYKDMVAEIHLQRRLLNSARTKLEKIKEKIHSTQHQIEVHKCETQLVNERIKDANWSFTKDICLQLAKLKKPIPEIVEIVVKFLALLERKDRTWQGFQDLSKNYNALKSQMESFNVDNMKEEIVEELIPLWKHQTTLFEKISGVSKGTTILLEWVSACVEYRVKKLTLNDLKKTETELQVRLKDQIAVITQKNDLVSSLEKKLKKYGNYEDLPIQEMELDLANISNSTAFDSTNPVKESIVIKRMPNECKDENFEDDLEIIDETPISTQPIFKKNYSFSVKKNKNLFTHSTNESKESRASSCGSCSEILDEPSRLQKIQNILSSHDLRNKDTIIRNSKIEFQGKKPKPSGRKTILKYSLVNPILEESAEGFDEKKQHSPLRSSRETPRKNGTFINNH